MKKLSIIFGVVGIVLVVMIGVSVSFYNDYKWIGDVSKIEQTKRTVAQSPEEVKIWLHRIAKMQGTLKKIKNTEEFKSYFRRDSRGGIIEVHDLQGLKNFIKMQIVIDHGEKTGDLQAVVDAIVEVKIGVDNTERWKKFILTSSKIINIKGSAWTLPANVEAPVPID